MSRHGEWKGFPREQIPWHPEIDASKCTGCRTCFEFCTMACIRGMLKKNGQPSKNLFIV